MSTHWLLDGATRVALAIGLALLVDALIGDPVFSWHPVRLIGRLAETMEGFCRHLYGLSVPTDIAGRPDCALPAGSPARAPAGSQARAPVGSPAGALAGPELAPAQSKHLPDQAQDPGIRLESKAVAAGSLAWILTFGLSAGLALAFSWLAGLIHPVFGFVIDAAIIWSSIAPGDLAAHALRVKRALERDRREQSAALRETGAGRIVPNLDDPVLAPVHGRAAVAMIVGRDVSVLDEAGVARACVESVAESSVDGAAAPIFWAALLGPWAALAYRSVNTMDSMFGHRNTRYFSFGLVAARADDFANWLPARLSSILACLAAPAAGGSVRRAFASFFRYRLSHASPNAGHPEAAYAGAFGLRLGGPVRYPEGLAKKPWLNPAGQDAGIVDIQKAVRLMYIQALVSAMVFLTCRFALGLIVNTIQTTL